MFVGFYELLLVVGHKNFTTNSLIIDLFNYRRLTIIVTRVAPISSYLFSQNVIKKLTVE